MEWVQSVSAWTVATSCQAGLIALLLWSLHRRNHTTELLRWQYVLGILLIARLCLPATPSLSHHPLSWFPLESATNSHTSIASVASISPQQVQAEPTLPPSSPIAAANNDIEPVSTTVPWQLSLTFLWLIGFSIGLAKMIVSYSRHRALLRSCTPLKHPDLQSTVDQLSSQLKLPYPVAILTSEQISSAAVTGTRKPRIIVSSRFFKDLDPAQRRHVLAHELVHLKRCDPLVNWLSSFLQSIHWFNPLVRWALRQFQRDRELICDAAAIRLLGESQRRAYGETLVQVLASFRQHRSFPNLVPIISSKQEIKRRMIMITSNQLTNSRRPLLLAAGLAAVLTLAFTRPETVEAQSSKRKQDSSSETASPRLVGDAQIEFHYTTEPSPSTNQSIRLDDTSSRGSGSGVLVAPGHGKQRYKVFEIDVTAFKSGGILLIDVELGDGASAGSFDLFPPNVPLPKGSPEGSIAQAYDVLPGSARTIVHQFEKGQRYRFGATGNWFSEEGSTNDFRFSVRAVPQPNSHPHIAGTVSLPTVESVPIAVQEGLRVISHTADGKPEWIAVDQGKAKVLKLIPNSDLAIIANSDSNESEPQVVTVQRTVSLIADGDPEGNPQKMIIRKDKNSKEGVTVFYNVDTKKKESSDSKVSN